MESKQPVHHLHHPQQQQQQQLQQLHKVTDKYRLLREEEEEEGLCSSDRSVAFLQAMIECRLQDKNVKTFNDYVDSYCQAHNLVSPIGFPLDHPVEEVARYILQTNAGRKGGIM